MSLSPPPADLTAYEIPTSLWSIVENNVPAHEREEVKNMLGSCLVDQSIELHQEAELLLDIWRDYREETNTIVEMPKRLPEPPQLRDRLRQEICFFIEEIREKSTRTGLDSMRILAKHNKGILDYAMDEERPGSSGYSSRPSTARSSRNGRETPMMRIDTPTSDRFSQTSALSEEVEKMQDKLNILKLDEVVSHLRETLEEEIVSIHRDINFLQGCLDEEADYRSSSSMGFMDREPSLADLRDERNQLEKDLLRQESPIPEVLRDRPRNSAKHAPAIRRQSAQSALSPLVPSSGSNVPHKPTPPKMRPSSQGMDSVRTRTAPMKASHTIGSAQVLTVNRNDSVAAKTEDLSCANRTALRKARSLDRENCDMTETNAKITVRTGSASSLPRSAKLVRVATVPTRAFENPEEQNLGTFSKPSSRPNSATRFRRMVMGCRDDQEPTTVESAS